MERTNVRLHTHFTDFVKPAQVVHDLEAKDRVAAVEELLDVLVKQKLLTNKKPVLTRIIDRENLETTAIGMGVALPHARVDTGGDIAIAVGRSEKGIDFEAPDGQKVQLVILVVWNPELPGLFNHLFAGLARFLIKPANRQRLFQAKDRAELHAVLSEIELRFYEEDKIIHRASVLRKLQELEIKRRKARKEQRKEIQKQAAMLREELDDALLGRFDKLMERYGFAVAEVVDGVCQGCNINLSTQMHSAIEGSNDIYVCENCGKFLVCPGKKKKK
ncbi:MAG: PTS sugar transporter subunit IIA [Candidatus Aminicenantes bacterium]|nr:PTS sugar transporter subunit IIA [Candidatus Aminicenantes bacterium]